MENISFIGGDNRNLILSNILEKEGVYIYNYGLKSQQEYNLEYCINKSKIIITAIPFSVDGDNIFSPLNDNKIDINDFVKMTKDKIVFCGNIQKKYEEKLIKKNNTIIDFMKQEQFVIMNTIPTAEGVIKLIIENTRITIHNSKVAVIGFGRVGKAISKLLYAMGANVFCIDNKQEEVANIKCCGYNVIKNINTELKDMDSIVNTVPNRLIGKEEFEFISKDTFILDVASKPGGIDFEYAKNNGYNIIHALGLPGKVAPITSAKYMKEIVENFIIRGVNNV